MFVVLAVVVVVAVVAAAVTVSVMKNSFALLSSRLKWQKAEAWNEWLQHAICVCVCVMICAVTQVGVSINIYDVPCIMQ